MVLTNSGYKEINLINIGDVLIGFNGVNNTVLRKRYFDRTWFINQNCEEQFKWYLINGTEKVFNNQNIFVKQGEYNVCHISELKTGWIIYDKNRNDLIIESIVEIEDEEGWWSFELTGDHSYISDGLILHNASRFWVGGGASANWSATANTNWSATNAGSNNASVPTTTDDVTFNGSGTTANTSSIISATITILSLTISSGYTATMTHNALLTIAGNWTFGTSYTVAGTQGVTISSGSSITSNGRTWTLPLTFNGGNTTKTLIGDLTVSGLFSTSNSSQTINKTTSEILRLNGGATINATTLGTADIIIGGGTWTGAGGTSFTNNVTLTGTIIINGSTVQYGGGTLLNSGATATTTGSTLTLGTNCTLDTNGINWNNITIANTLTTLTNNSLLTVNGTLLLNAQANVVFSGTSPFTVGTLSNISTQATTITLKSGLTYTITTGLSSFLTRNGSSLSFTSSDSTLKANLTLNYGATCNCLANFTRINASGGRTINTFNGTVTNCNNINSFNDLITVGF